MTEIKTIIQDYINSRDSDYAIMINGEWGAGKTYYWQNELKPLIESKIFQNKTQEHEEVKYEAIYVSLYGLSNISDLNNKIFIEINPIWKNKGVKITANITKGLVNKGLSFLGVDKIEQSDYQSIIDNIGIPQSKVLCFDDLERLDSKILNEVFGQINSLTEHDKLKVIILCNEPEISNKITEYNKTKEKLIRFTYKFSADISKLFNNFTKKYEREYQIFLEKNQNLIISLYTKANYRNLRTLKFNLDLFEKVHSHISSNSNIEEQYKDDILSKLLIFTTTYSIEYKNGIEREKLNQLKTISTDNGLNLNRIDFSRILLNSGQEEKTEKEKDYHEIFQERYLSHGDISYIYSEAIANYIHSGVLNNTELTTQEETIQDTLKKKQSLPEYQAIEKLNNLLNLEDNEFWPLIGHVIEYVKSGKYETLSYPSIFLTLLRIESSSINEFKITEEIIGSFKEGIPKSKFNSKYIESFAHRVPNFVNSDSRYEEVKDLAIAINNSHKDDRKEKLAQELIKTLRGHENSFTFLTNEDHKFESFFSFVDPQEVFDIVLSLPNILKQSFNQGLNEKYKYMHVSQEGNNDLTFLIDLLTLANNHVMQDSKRSISTVVIQDLSLILHNIIHRS